MALTDLQKRVMRRLSVNRSQSSYLAGGLILNLDWPRRSDDIDIFHDTDEEVSEVAERDIADLENEGFRVTVDVRAYAAVKGLPAEWTPQFIRAEITKQLNLAESYIMNAPVAVVGVLSVDAHGTPIEVTNETIKTSILRKATEEPDIMPMPAEFSTTPWSGR